LNHCFQWQLVKTVILLPTVLRDSLLLLLPPCFYIAKCNKRECCCIWLSGPGFQDLDKRTLGFRNPAPRQTHARNTSPHHPSNMPPLFLFLPVGKGKMAGRRILPTAHYFQEKICAMEFVGYRIYKMANGDGRRRRRRRVGEEKRLVYGFFYYRNFTGRTGLCIFYGRTGSTGQLKRRTVASDRPSTRGFRTWVSGPRKLSILRSSYLFPVTFLCVQWSQTHARTK